MLLGVIADDFTGATDLANNLVRAGMRVVQTIGVPAAPLAVDVDCVVVALKSRTIAPADAIAQSLEALEWLQAQGAEQIYFKYCSTFDSTAAGNIGPVTEALMEALGTDFTIATPAFPDNKRTVFKGYLFAGDVLFAGSIGRTDLPGGDHAQMLRSLATAVLPLADETVVLPGHGPMTTIGQERATNPFLQDLPPAPPTRGL